MNKNFKSISFGDKIFARVSRNGRTVLNFVSEQVANMSDLLSQLRKAMKDIQGLVMIHIRNYNQGWGEERPLMLYAEKRPYLKLVTTKEPIEKNDSKKMIFPWDTH